MLLRVELYTRLGVGRFFFLTPSSTGPFHRVKRWYLHRRLTSVILRVKQIPEVFRKARGALFKLGCLVWSGFECPLKIISVENPGEKRSKSRCLRRSLTSVIFGVRQIPEVFQKGHVLIYNAGYLHLSQIWIRWKLCPLKICFISKSLHFAVENVWMGFTLIGQVAICVNPRALYLSIQLSTCPISVKAIAGAPFETARVLWFGALVFRRLLS